MIEDYKHIQELADEDVIVLQEKGMTYGSSWRDRGGVGAFMMLARKWDRLENQCRAKGYDIFQVIQDDRMVNGLEGVLDDIRDLRRYLLLVDSHLTAPKTGCAQADYNGYDPVHIGGTDGTACGRLEARGERFDGTEHK